MTVLAPKGVALPVAAVLDVDRQHVVTSLVLHDSPGNIAVGEHGVGGDGGPVQSGNSTTEAGAYSLNGATSGNFDVWRNPGANYWIPSEDEWYKAAYHQPSVGGLGGAKRRLLALSDG